jgi:hypothetical protein
MYMPIMTAASTTSSRPEECEIVKDARVLEI